jgi:hypothetical protein
MSDVESKRTLENALGKLLGFEEGEAEDLLEHLFTIDSDEDLSEYLVQLLGGQSPEMVDFVRNMSRYRRGESITTSAENDDDDDDQKESSNKAETVASSQDTAALDSFRAMAIGNNTKTPKKSVGRKNTKQKQGSKSRVPPPKNENNTKSPPSPNSSASDQSQNPSSSSSSPNSEAQNPSLQKQSKQPHKNGVAEKSHPSRGKAKIVCGCFGTKHKALTNCLYCGRISCEAEGYGFCPFCGIMVEAGM